MVTRLPQGPRDLPRWFAGGLAHRHRQRFWQTKSFEFWTLLMVMLHVLRPRGIVEFGSGRSTSYLGEYAMKSHARYVSIEQSGRFALQNGLALALGLIDPTYIRRVRLRPDGWYDGAVLDEIINFSPDLLFIDGPTKIAGHRHVPRALRLHRSLLPDVRLLLVDDVHRREVLKVHAELAALMPDARTLYIEYGSRGNLIACTMSHADAERVEALAADLDLALAAPPEPGSTDPELRTR